MNDTIRTLLSKLGGLPVASIRWPMTRTSMPPASPLLHRLQLMLGLEEAFDMEFPDHLLNRKSFASIAAIEATVQIILKDREVA